MNALNLIFQIASQKVQGGGGGDDSGAILDLAGGGFFPGFFNIDTLPAACYEQTLPIYIRYIIIIIIAVDIVAAVFMVGYAAIQFIISGGVVEKIQNAFQTFRNIILGLVVSFVAAIFILILLNAYIGTLEIDSDCEDTTVDLEQSLWSAAC